MMKEVPQEKMSVALRTLKQYNQFKTPGMTPFVLWIKAREESGYE